jgi:hypothetical protein
VFFESVVELSDESAFVMNLIFIIDKAYDRRHVTDKKLLVTFDERHKLLLPYVKKTIPLYTTSWNEIGNQFSEYVTRITGYEWYYSEYKCVLSITRRGVSNWGRAPKIMRTWQENPYAMRRITAHELILSHYFEIYRRNYASHEGLTDGQVWALAEIAAWAMTSLEPQIKKWWPWSMEYYYNHNYQLLVPLQKKMKVAYLNRRNFDEYMQHGFKLVRLYPHMVPPKR